MQFPFLSVIELLRNSEEILLYGNLLQIPEEEHERVRQFLRDEYKKEAIGYPFDPPPFDAEAGLWAAQTVYLSVQLLLYRENKISDIEALIPTYNGPITAGAILSADLLLRFLPGLLAELRMIDIEDRLIPLLEAHLGAWHYSGVGYGLPTEALDFEPVTGSNCLRQLYTDRVIQHKDLRLARHEALSESVKASLGIHALQFWKDYQQELIFENEPEQ